MLDGMVAVLKMKSWKERTSPAAKPKESKKKPRNKKAKPVPQGSFTFSPDMKKNYCLIILRDKTRARWPNHYLARPGSEGIIKSSGSGSFTIVGEGHQVDMIRGTLAQTMRLAGEKLPRRPLPIKKVANAAARRFPIFLWK